MARIPDDELERLKRDVSLVALVEASGVALEPRGKDLFGRCIFHEGDTDPSLSVSPQKNAFHCFGCGAKGSVVDWVMKTEGVSFRHAVALLRAGDYAPAPPGAGIAKDAPKLPPILEPDAGDQALLGQVLAYYHATLLESPEALAYCAERGIGGAGALERFRIGFSNRTLGYRLPPKSRLAGRAIRERLQALGILRPSGHEHLRGALVIPVPDGRGGTGEVYGRKIGKGLRKGTPVHLYLPGPHRGIWNREALAASDEVILCESLIDALTFWCAGFRNVTASYGTNGVTEELLEAFGEHGVRRVLIAFDADAAGDAAAAALARRLAADGIGPYRVAFPRGMDANAYALEVTPAADGLALLLARATWMGEGPAPARAGASAPGVPEAAKGEAKGSPVPEPAPDPPAPPAPPDSAPPPPPPADEEPSSPLAAAPKAPSVRSRVPAELKGDEVVLRLGDRRYRVRGLKRNLSFDQLRVNLLCGRADAFHVDTLDLYAAKPRAAFVKAAAAEIGAEEETVKRDLGRVLLALEELQERVLADALEPKAKRAPEIAAAEREEALALLRAPDLPGRILADFERSGVVGEETNKLVGYLTAISRKLEEPLAVIIQSSSAAGKTSLLDAILAFVPEEDREQYSAMTGQSLFYMEERDLRHKVLAIVEELRP